ncbi:calcium/calmodulin-dependent protein kinase type II subunit alpha-like [Macrosteles quadrilineatus]|uniref:calcium/calmodulin-dependent protein kinase type II subunit alpha-like n=1 Tax=Macrosteles quadrilineatus TaxID=74068 RepID=UPI0023E19F0A|nr:calcium/calmodulin-dependent protein kinase type II subunit alpha-like [Macrosteles quadrilineatus]
MKKLEMEARVCRKLNHPNIVRLHKVISLEKIHVFLFDLVTGGELFDDLVTRDGNYTEELAAKCMFQMLEAIKYCHTMGVVHRDLKPENILLESKEKKIIKLADFGLAVEVEGDQDKFFGLSGTPNYMAPEVLEMKPYGKPVDCWSCGVIMYILLTGQQPFYHQDPRKLEKLIKEGDYYLDSLTWSHVTPEAKDLMQKLLCVVPKHRLTAAQALQHPWFVKIRTAKRTWLHRSDTFEALRRFNARRKMRAAINTTLFISKCYLTAKRREGDNSSSHSTVPSAVVSNKSSRKGLSKSTKK